MPLPYKITKESDIPAAHKDLYVNRNGVWLLDATGAADADELNQFRDNNRELMRLTGEPTIEKAKAKLATLKDVDPVEYARLKTESDASAAEKAKREGKLEDLHKGQVEALNKAHEKVVTDQRAETDRLNSRLRTVLVDNALQAAAALAGIRAEAMPDALGRGRAVFELDGENVIAKKVDGKQWFNEKGQPLTMAEWFEVLAKEAKHLFGESAGAGAAGNGGEAFGYKGPNPFSKATINRETQNRLRRENPPLAKRLEETAK